MLIQNHYAIYDNIGWIFWDTILFSLLLFLSCISVLLLLLMVITYYLFLLKITLCQNHHNLFPNNMIF